MRAALTLAREHNPGAERHPKGSIVLCAACWKPLYKLETGVTFGDKVRSDSFRPLTEADYDALATRAMQDKGLNPGVAGLWRSWTQDQRKAFVAHLSAPRPGDLMMCPFCQKSFAFHWAKEAAEAIDHAYVCDLLTIPPDAPVPTRALREWSE